MFKRIVVTTTGAIIVTTGLVVAGLAIAVDQDVWPSDWSDEQEAALLAAIISGYVALTAAGLKAIFDQMSAVSAHRSKVSELVFGGYEDYSSEMVIPLMAATAELAANLRSWNAYGLNDDLRVSCLYSVCRYTECLSKLRVRYTRLNSTIPDRGLFLSKPHFERLIWGLLVEPWVLGVPGVFGEVYAVRAVRNDLGHLLPPSEMPGDVTPSDFRYLDDCVIDALSDERRRHLLESTMRAANGVLDWAVAKVYEPWYETNASFPSSVLKPVWRIPTKEREEIGIKLLAPTFGHRIEYMLDLLVWRLFRRT